MNRLYSLKEKVEVAVCREAVYEVVCLANGTTRLVAGVQGSNPEVLEALVRTLPGPFALLYVLHTPRGEGVPGRYQSPEMDLESVAEFLKKFRGFLMSDGRYDLWVRCFGSRSTLVWDRHDLLFGYGDEQAFSRALERVGYIPGRVAQLGAHAHHYRAENDHAAAFLLSYLPWVHSALKPEDEQ